MIAPERSFGMLFQVESLLGLATRLSSHVNGVNGIDLQRCTVSNKTTKNRAKFLNKPHFYSILCYNKSNAAMLKHTE